MSVLNGTKVQLDVKRNILRLLVSFFHVPILCCTYENCVVAVHIFSCTFYLDRILITKKGKH